MPWPMGGRHEVVELRLRLSLIASDGARGGQEHENDYLGAQNTQAPTGVMCRILRM